jgi:hypothetical protein
VKLADKSDLYLSRNDVEPLIEQRTRGACRKPRSKRSLSLTDFIEKHYLPWCQAHKSAPTANYYRRVWENYWKRYIGAVVLTNLQMHTRHVTACLMG